jgi:hypothetical protein
LGFIAGFGRYLSLPEGRSGKGAGVRGAIIIGLAEVIKNFNGLKVIKATMVAVFSSQSHVADKDWEKPIKTVNCGASAATCRGTAC